MPFWEASLYSGTGLALAAAIDYVFYRDPLFFFFLMPLGLLVPLWMRRRRMNQRREKLGSQFKDAILAISSALQAGYSAENAWREAWQELICI